jgi:hypothetical protein
MTEASSASRYELRREAEAHLRWLLEESEVLPDLPRPDQIGLDQIDSLPGGVDAAHI